MAGASYWAPKPRCESMLPNCSYLEPTKFVILRIFNFWTKFCPNLMILVFLESWDWDLSKLVIRFWRTMPNFQILSNFKFRSSPKFPISSNFKFCKIQILTKNQNSATVVYCNFVILSKFQSQNFPKLVRIWSHNRDKTKFSKIISIPKSQIHQNWLWSPKFCKKNS